MFSSLSSLIQSSVELASEAGYFGIFIGMFLESTIIPIPSELIMIPAGIAAAQDKMDMATILFYGISGNVAGAIFSYYLALIVGLPLLLKIGKFLLVTPKTIKKMEDFFNRYGGISIFIGRMLPGFRHFISTPAGIAKMNIWRFCLYTTLGSSIWACVLVVSGFLIGKSHHAIEGNLHLISQLFLVLAIIALSFFCYKKYKSTKK